jgi:hypothetical protein
MVAVDVTQKVRNERIAESGENPSDLLQHPTEREIPKLFEDADYRVDGEGSGAEMAEIARRVAL